MKLLLSFALMLCGLAVQGARFSPMQAVDLQCEYLTTPLGIDVAEPRLMWKLQSPVGGVSQSAYRVVVATSPEQLEAGNADVWNSGRIKSGDQTVVCSPAAPLKSHTRYFWKVETWDDNGRMPVTTPVSWFETGKMTPGEWKAQWITDSHDKQYKPAPMFRREFATGKQIASARAYICGLGYYELYLNGERVGDHLLDPGYTDFSKRVLYVTYDITAQLGEGKNCIGVVLGNGWYNEQTPAVWNFHLAPWRDRPRLLCELHVTYRDGSTETIGSDASWKTATGPLLYDNLYTGVTYDARLEQPGWNRPGFDDGAWQPAVTVQSPAPLIEAQKMAAVAASGSVKPVSVEKINDTVYVYNLGKNFAGVCRLRVKGPRGTVVTMRHGELLDSAGRVDQRNINMHLRPTNASEISQFDTYILKGEGAETFMPPFTYHGFQYVEVTTSVPLQLTAENLEGIVMHSDVRPTGDFSCSNKLINQIFDISKRSYLSNLFGIPTDCPHREKNGWMADGYMVQEAGMINFDSRNIYAKWVNDMIDAQEADGNVPGIVPTSWHWDSNWAGPMWDAAIFITPHLLYQYSGDTRAIETIYPAAKRYLEYLQTREEANGTINHGLGDWLFYKAQTPVDFMATCFYYWDNVLMAQMARLTGREPEAAPYEAKAEKLKVLINELFFDPEKVCYSNGTQLSYALPLYVGIVPEQYEKRLAENLNRCIADNDYSLDFGFIGSLVVPAVLSDYGYADAVYRMVTKTTLPSWGYWIEQCGATSLFETWDVLRNIGDASRNHPSMGAVSAWMYKTLAGIQVDPEQPAFRHVLIRPAFVDGLNWAKASYDSQRGEIRSAWERNGDRVTLNVQIPANMTATVSLPSAAVEAVGCKGNAKNIRKITDIKSSGVAYRIGSGAYRFTCTIN